ncbi:MAG: T9SS type A sorting domain-containing protein [Calditrichota bacterium]
MDRSGNTLWQNTNIMNGSSENHSLAVQENGTVLLAGLGDSTNVICVDTANIQMQRTHCTPTHLFWNSGFSFYDTWIDLIMPFNTNTALWVRRFYIFVEHNGGRAGTTLGVSDEFCTESGLGSGDYDWYNGDLSANHGQWGWAAWTHGQGLALVTAAHPYRMTFAGVEAPVRLAVSADGGSLLASWLPDSSLYLLSVASNGGTLWSRQCNDIRGIPTDVLSMPNGDWIVTGNLSEHSVGRRIFATHLDADGDRNWMFDFGHTGSDITVSDIENTHDGELVLAGTIDGSPYLIRTSVDAVSAWAEVSHLEAIPSDSGINIVFDVDYQVGVSTYEIFKRRSPHYPFQLAGSVIASQTSGSYWPYCFQDFGAGGPWTYCISFLTTSGRRYELPELTASVDRTTTVISSFSVYNSTDVVIELESSFEFANSGFLINRRDTASSYELTVVRFNSIGSSYSAHRYRAIDDNVVDGAYIYTPSSIDSIGRIIRHSELSVYIEIDNHPADAIGNPLNYSLTAYPNPFNPSTTIKFSHSRREEVEINIFDIQGRVVKEIVRKTYQPGIYQVPFDGSELPAGLYFARLTMPGFTQTQKMVLLK